MSEFSREMSVTELGNPRKPQGKAGEEMLRRMNSSHYDVTGWAMDFFEFKGNESFLDIGCGGGETLRRAAEILPLGHLTGIDYSDISVSLSRKNNEKSINQGRMTIEKCSVESMPFDDDIFDKIITVESFYFWPDPQENLKEVYRVLSKNGVFMIVADVYGDAELSEENIESIKKYDLFNPTLDDYKKLLENAGFNDVVIHTKAGTSWVCAEGRK